MPRGHRRSSAVNEYEKRCLQGGGAPAVEVEAMGHRDAATEAKEDAVEQLTERPASSAASPAAPPMADQRADSAGEHAQQAARLPEGSPGGATGGEPSTTPGSPTPHGQSSPAESPAEPHPEAVDTVMEEASASEPLASQAQSSRFQEGVAAAGASDRLDLAQGAGDAGGMEGCSQSPQREGEGVRRGRE